MSTIQNATIKPKLFYGLHFTEGVAEYLDETANEPYRILIKEDAMRAMDPSFAGCPVFVEHVEEVDYSDIDKADGYVVESFYNKSDGKHWVKFLIKTDEGHKAIADKFTLSNAYHIKDTGPGGQWHQIDYLKEVKSGEYEHLALVKNPRYSESVIMTPEEFKDYNLRKDAELNRLTNSIPDTNKGDPVMKLNFFKRAKVENSVELEGLMLVLPKSGKEVSITELVTNADKDAKESMANGESKVKVGDGEMSVNELVEKYNSMCAKNAEDEDKKENQTPDENPTNEGDDADDMDNAEDEDKKNESEDDKPSQKNAKDAAAKKANFDKLKNAKSTAVVNESHVIETMSAKIARGNERYGSGR